MKSKYVVNDPWPSRLRDWYWRRIHCPLFGHVAIRKMYVVICERCRRELS